MKKKTNLLLLFCALFFAFNLHAQTSVDGKVTDVDSSDPIAGVNVVVKGTSTGTASDFDGNFSISVSQGDVLVFSYVGYSTQEITYNGQLSLSISMSEDASQLDEVLLIGYGTVKKEDLTINHLLNYPNPFTTHTEFYFEHNQVFNSLAPSVIENDCPQK